MKIKIFLFYLLIIFFLCISYNYANPDYQEVNTSLGKVIVGLNKEEVLERFGSPTSASEDIWYYSAPSTFFVYFSAGAVSSINLYPQFCETSTGVPFELKVFGYFPDLKVKDITSQVQFLFSDPKNLLSEKPGIIIADKPGEYQVLAKYKDIVSNPSYISIRGSQVKETEKETEKEKLLNIDVFPFKPKIPPRSKLNFIALGTFFDFSQNRYFIRDISQEVTWFLQQDKIANVGGQEIYFPSAGKFNVFCRYRDIESFPQEVEVESNLTSFKQTLKHVALLPEFIFTNLNSDITLRAFGTYYNNKVEDITPKVNWEISDRDIITELENGKFLSKSEGITEVVARSDDLESLPTKIIVAAKKDALSTPMPYTKPKKSKIDSAGVIGDIQNNVESISDSLIKEKNLRLIKITPDYLKIPLGQMRQVVALGIYSDNSQVDLTLLGEWMSSDNKVVKVNKGIIDGISAGEAKIYMKFKELVSLPASVIVEGPKLVSVIISPQSSQISMRDSLNLKAEGYFSDSSRKEITSLVNWELTRPEIIKIEKGAVRPLRIGQTQVRAEYLDIESLPADIKVILTWGWLAYLIIKGIVFLILAIITVFFVLYFLTEKEKDKLKTLFNTNPREFIVSVYGNAKRISAIFGLSYQEFIPPLSYAKLVEDGYSIKDNLFSRFTAKFEEAKYSCHNLQSNDAASVLDDYHNFLKILFSRYNRFSLFFKYCLTLIYRKPLFIHLCPSTGKATGGGL